MTYEMKLNEEHRRGLEEGRKEGREEGRKEGREEGANLITKLLKLLTPGSQEYEDALNGTKEVRDELYKKYNII